MEKKKLDWLGLVAAVLGLITVIMLFVPAMKLSAGGLSVGYTALELMDMGSTETTIVAVIGIVAAVVGLLLLVFGLLGLFGVVKKARVANLVIAIIGLVVAVAQIVVVIIMSGDVGEGVSLVPLAGILSAVMFVAYIISAISFKFAQKK